MIRVAPLFVLASSLLLAAPSHGQAAGAEASTTPPSAQPHHGPPQNPVRVFHLRYAAQVNEANEIMVALRNVLQPTTKIYLLSASNDVVVAAPPDQLEVTDELIKQLDHPKPNYRITYTLAESDNGKRIGVQHFSMITVPGQRLQLKQGDKIPVLTGSYNTDKSATENQFTYLDVGMNFDITVDPFANGLRLRSRVEQSSVAQEHQTGALADEPIVRQSVLEGTAVIVPGKPLTLGGIDIVGSTRHIDVEVIAEPLS